MRIINPVISWFSEVDWMIRGFFNSRLLILLLFILFVSFIIGYDYAVITSQTPPASTISTPVSLPDTALPE